MYAPSSPAGIACNLIIHFTANAAQMWPYVDSAVSDVGLQRLDKALKERRARWMLDVAVEQCVSGLSAQQ